MTVARQPVTGTLAKPLDPKLDAMSAPETADFRIALEESGLTPVAGSISTAMEGDASVESVAFRCKPASGGEVVVLTTTWRTGGQALRARLQFPEGYSNQMGALLNAIRSSVRFRNASTLGFGGFRMAQDQPPAEWIRMAGTPAPAPAPAAITPAALTASTPSTSAPAVVTDGSGAQLVQNYRGSLVFIEDGGGAGSGFVCQTKDGVFLLTNQHVVAGMKAPRFTRLDAAPITAGTGAAAVGHDLMRFATQGEARPLAAMSDVEAEAQIGDEIVVLGNKEGARVIQPLTGKLIGIGPDRVEVTAEFLPGNSGSPIIHVKTGKVIGIATYLMQGRFAELTDSKDTKVRRFGFRLDSVKQWQPLNWQAFQQDKGTMDRVESTTRDLVRLIRTMQSDQRPSTVTYANSAISRAVRDLDGALSKQSLSAPDRARVFQNFLATLRATTQSDITQARQTLRYDYFSRALGEESQVREQMYKLFDRLLKAR